MERAYETRINEAAAVAVRSKDTSVTSAEQLFILGARELS